MAKFKSPVVTITALMCCITLVLSLSDSAQSITTTYFTCYFSSWKDIWQYPRLLFHIFGYTSWPALFNDLLIFLLVGTIAENKFQSKFVPMLMVIIVTAVATGLLHCVLDAGGNPISGLSPVITACFIVAALRNLNDMDLPVLFALIIYTVLTINSLLQGELNLAAFVPIIGGVLGSMFALMFK